MKELVRELFDLYHRDVYLYLYSLSRDAALSEDLTSEVFLEVVQSIHRFRGDSDVKTWLFAIARHKWFAHLRKKKAQPPLELLDELLVSASRSPEDRVCDQAAAQRVHDLLAQEPERTQTIVSLRLEGWSFHEIGQQVGVSESSARVIDFRAKAKIRDALKKEGFLDE